MLMKNSSRRVGFQHCVAGDGPSFAECSKDKDRDSVEKLQEIGHDGDDAEQDALAIA